MRKFKLKKLATLLTATTILTATLVTNTASALQRIGVYKDTGSTYTILFNYDQNTVKVSFINRHTVTTKYKCDADGVPIKSGVTEDKPTKGTRSREDDADSVIMKTKYDEYIDLLC